jgi:hypothetical protein
MPNLDVVLDIVRNARRRTAAERAKAVAWLQKAIEDKLALIETDGGTRLV